MEIAAACAEPSPAMIIPPPLVFLARDISISHAKYSEAGDIELHILHTFVCTFTDTIAGAMGSQGTHLQSLVVPVYEDLPIMTDDDVNELAEYAEGRNCYLLIIINDVFDYLLYMMFFPLY